MVELQSTTHGLVIHAGVQQKSGQVFCESKLAM